MSANQEAAIRVNSSYFRKYCTTLLVLAVVVLLVVRLCLPVAQKESDVGVKASLERELPNADPLLINRVSSIGCTAIDVAKKHGEEGLNVLDVFGEESAYCSEATPEIFSSLIQVWNLDQASHFRISTGSWRRGVLEWAQNGKLNAFLRKLGALPDARLSTIEDVPSALSLLLEDTAPTAHAMLRQYGDRAWRLFMYIDFHDSTNSIERVAKAVEKYGELSLTLNDNFGLSPALMLVARDEDANSCRLPDIAAHAFRELDHELAVVLMLANYDDIEKMLSEGTTVEQIREAIDLLAAQPKFVQMLAVESRHVVRLFCETWYGQRIGVEAFQRCGPAATIAYTNGFYGSEKQLSQPAIVAMARVGWPAFEALDRYREYGPFYDLLRRPELMERNELDPLIVDAIGNVEQHGQGKIDIYVKSQNLVGELMQDRYAPRESEQLLQWVPLYMAYRVSEKYVQGLHVSNEELLFAAVDVALTFMVVKGTSKAVNGAKSLAGAIEREGTEAVAKQGLAQGGRIVAQQLERSASRAIHGAEKAALELLKREGANLTHLGDDAGLLALKRLEARGEGIALGLADRSTEYSAARKLGDLGNKNLIAEEIGIEGMTQYASATGRTPIYIGKARQGAGFDGVFRDGERILVIEAKGGGSQVKHFHGHWQGTPEYTRAVAKDVLAKSSRSADEKTAASEVLKALNEQRIDIEVLRTNHVQGKPLPTRVESSVSLGNVASKLSPSEIKGLLLRTPGATIAFVRDNELGEVSIETFIHRSQKMASRAGVELWKPGAGPLIPRTVTRKGQQITIETIKLATAGEMNGVGDFAIALTERKLR